MILGNILWVNVYNVITISPEMRCTTKDVQSRPQREIGVRLTFLLQTTVQLNVCDASSMSHHAFPCVSNFTSSKSSNLSDRVNDPFEKGSKRGLRCEIPRIISPVVRSTVRPVTHQSYILVLMNSFHFLVHFNRSHSVEADAELSGQVRHIDRSRHHFSRESGQGYSYKKTSTIHS